MADVPLRCMPTTTKAARALEDAAAGLRGWRLDEGMAEVPDRSNG
jgi:hypothetical protein